jgi:heterotetrameric sarcosine oxidase gamma subunit
MTSIAPFPGKRVAVEAALGMAFPEPNTIVSAGEARLVWTGRDQAFLIGAPAPDLTGLAATTDQSDGWAAFTLTGPLAADALMRLIPLDLRATAFPSGRAVRAPLNHMNMILMRGQEGFTLLCFRSMARTAWHEVETALTHLAARARVAG